MPELTVADYQIHTANWVKQVIVKYNLCPFARPEVESDRIRYRVIEETQPTAVLQELLAECRLLDEQPEIATTLLIMPRGFEGFYGYLDLVDSADELLVEQGFEGHYQLASFHPDYCFDGEPQADAANYTNRAPYPTLHIIREASLELALASYDHPEQIPERNVAFTRRKGSDFFAELLAKCMSATK